MKCYFDNRYREGIAVSVYCDNILYDELYLKKDSIVLIDIESDCKTFRFSFGGAYNVAKRVERKIVDTLPSEINEEERFTKSCYAYKGIDFPYDTIVHFSNENKDVILYPTRLEPCKVKNISYFKAITAHGGCSIPTILIKKDDLGIEKEKKNVVKAVPYFITGMLFHILVSLLTLKTEYSIPAITVKRHDMAKIVIILSVIFIILALWMVFRFLSYREIYHEEDLEEKIDLSN